MTLISAMIVIFNPGEEVLDCIASLQAAAESIPLEIIVVDNASGNDMPQRIQQAFPDITYLRSETNLGFGGGNNLAFRHSHGDLVLCINPDLILKPGALSAMQTYLQQNPDVGIVGPRIVDSNGEVTISARPRYTLWRIWAKYWALDKLMPRLVIADYDSRIKEATAPFQVDWLQGACLLIRREAYEQVGGYDEAFFLYMEDTDLCDRIHQQGWQVIYLPQAEAQHHGGSTTSRFHLIRIRSYHRSPIHYQRKRGSQLSVYLLKAIFGAELLGKVTARAIANQFRYREMRASQLQAEWQVFKELWQY